MHRFIYKIKIDWFIVFSSIIPFFLAFYLAGGAGELALMALSGMFFSFFSFFLIYFLQRMHSVKKYALFFILLTGLSCVTFYPAHVLYFNFNFSKEILMYITLFLISGFSCITLLFATKIEKKRGILLFLFLNIILFLSSFIFQLNFKDNVVFIWHKIGLTCPFYWYGFIIWIFLYFFYSIGSFLTRFFTNTLK